jgi:hypothetical protein
MSVDIVTRSHDFARTGANTAETILTPDAVKTRGVKVLRHFQPDDPRLEAQPLYLSGMNIKGSKRNVIYQATMGNSIFAWDADTGETLWKTSLGTPVNSKTAINAKGNQIDVHNINLNWGVMSTPVIDRGAGILYACAWVATDNKGDWKNAIHKVFAVDIVTGALRPEKPPLSLEGVTYQANANVPKKVFNSIERKQRAALGMAKGAVIICFGTIFETDKSALGWVIAVDTATWITTAWCSMAVGVGAGIWMSGAGPAIQSDGSIWVVTGNGDFDGETDFGESVVRLEYTPPTKNTKGSLKVSGSWTPWTDEAREGADPTGHTLEEERKIQDLPKASNLQKKKAIAALGIKLKNKDWSDEDLGASGIVLLENLGIGLVSGKDGILYTINLNNPGNTSPGDLKAKSMPANYAKLAAPPILYTFFDPTMNPATTDPTTLNRFPGGATHHLHGTPVAWQNATHGQMHFCGGENGNVRGWKILGNKASSFLGSSAAFASPNSVDSPIPGAPKGGMPGWSLALSANGNTGGVVWGMMPYGDANTGVVNGRLMAFDAVNFSTFNGGSGQIVPLWDSQDWNWNFSHPKFNRPVVADGKLLVPTYGQGLWVVGLA